MFLTMHGIDSITPRELADKRASGHDFLLLDVRTPMENAAGAIDGSCLIPVQELESRISELPRDREIVVYCRVGNRSAYACAYLARQGYKAVNLEGGIARWSLRTPEAAGVSS